jgi:hypothetical protein
MSWTNWHHEKSYRPQQSYPLCTRCENRTAPSLLKHGYCPPCRAELRAEQQALDAVIREAFERGIVEADLHAELIQSESL